MDHTPGPWKVALGNPMTVIRDVEYGGGYIGSTSAWWYDPEAAEANARLIAAAPELLEALEGIQAALSAWLNGDTNAEGLLEEAKYNIVDAAIAKATETQ